MGGYVGLLQLGNDNTNLIAFGDVLYGKCRTPASTAAKTVVNNTEYTDFPAGFQSLMDGIQVRIKFVEGNTVATGVSLQILSTNAIPVQGDCRCNANEVICFTFEENPSATSYWRVTSGGISGSVQDYVNTAVGQMTGAVDSMVFKGTIGTGGNPGTLPTTNYKKGWTYKVITANTYAGQECEIGDLIIAINDGPTSGSSVINADWTVAQTNIDGAVTGPISSTANHIAVYDGTTGKVIKDSGFTIETSVPADAVFTDENTSYQYSLTNTQTANAYTGTTTFDSNNAASKVLVSASNGVLHLEEGITFTTTAAMTSTTLSESAVAGPSLT